MASSRRARPGCSLAPAMGKGLAAQHGGGSNPTRTVCSSLLTAALRLLTPAAGTDVAVVATTLPVGIAPCGSTRGPGTRNACL